MATPIPTLNQYCPAWRGSLIPSAMSKLSQGIERERARLKGFPFITIEFSKEFDYDGLNEDLKLHAGFMDAASAIDYVNQNVEQTMATLLAEPRDDYWKWRHDLSSDNERFKSNHECDLVRGVHLRSFKLLSKSPYDSIYFQLEVLHVSDNAAFGPDFFSYFDADWEWWHYMMSKGEM